MQGHDESMEVGRACVDARYRRHQTMQLLWRGIAQYIQHHDVTLMFGCASFHGTDPDAHALPLSYLYYQRMAPLGFRPRAIRERYVSMRRLPREAVDEKAAVTALRSEEHTSELQSLMRISYAVFCLKKKKI